MNKQKMQEAMARLDGYETAKSGRFSIDGAVYQYRKDGKGENAIPDYFTDNVIDRMVRGLSEDEITEYVCRLDIVCSPDGTHIPSHAMGIMLKATPEQKVEAYLRAKGAWEDER